MSEDGVYVYPEFMVLKQEHDYSSETSSIRTTAATATTTTTTTTTTTPPTPPTAPTSKKVRKVTKGRNHHPLTSKIMVSLRRQSATGSN